MPAWHCLKLQGHKNRQICRSIGCGRHGNLFLVDTRSQSRINHFTAHASCCKKIYIRPGYAHTHTNTHKHAHEHAYMHSLRTSFHVFLMMMIIVCREAWYSWPWQLLISRGVLPSHFWKTSGQSSRSVSMYVCMHLAIIRLACPAEPCATHTRTYIHLNTEPCATRPSLDYLWSWLWCSTIPTLFPDHWSILSCSPFFKYYLS